MPPFFELPFHTDRKLQIAVNHCASIRNGNFAMIFTVPWALACNYYGVLVRLCFFASHMVEVGDGGLNPIRINRP